jgi:hypothetical protein
MQKVSPLPGFDPHTVQPVANRYTDWAIPAHTIDDNTDVDVQGGKGLMPHPSKGGKGLMPYPVYELW